MRQVRRFLRDKATNAYLGEDGSWTLHLPMAKHFDGIRSIIEAAANAHKEELEVVLMMHETPSQFDIVLPLQLRSHTPLTDETKHPDPPSLH